MMSDSRPTFDGLVSLRPVVVYMYCCPQKESSPYHANEARHVERKLHALVLRPRARVHRVVDLKRNRTPF